MAFTKISKREKRCMRNKGGYRENTIMDHARCYTSFGKGRYVVVHNRRKNGQSLDTATFDRKFCEWVN